MNREQEKAMFAKRKRTRNTTKRAKLGSHGFKVHKNTKFYIAKSTEGGWSRNPKPAFDPEKVQIFRDMWNTDPSLKALRKHVKEFSLVYSANPKYGGTWQPDKQKVKLYDYPYLSDDYFKHTIIHELVGHAFWQIARKYRREELVNFNRIANESDPVNDYVRKNAENWKQVNDENEDRKAFEKSVSHIPEWDASSELQQEYEEKEKAFKDKRASNGHDTMTRYANEQHSAITEILYNDNKGGHTILINDVQKQRLIEAWKKLHY